MSPFPLIQIIKRIDENNEENEYAGGTEVQAILFGNIPKVSLLWQTGICIDYFSSNSSWHLGDILSEFMGCCGVFNILCFVLFFDNAINDV